MKIFDNLEPETKKELKKIGLAIGFFILFIILLVVILKIIAYYHGYYIDDEQCFMDIAKSECGSLKIDMIDNSQYDFSCSGVTNASSRLASDRDVTYEYYNFLCEDKFKCRNYIKHGEPLERTLQEVCG